jgi:flagellin-like protein
MKVINRRAISPIIATVLIIAVTLIAAVAIGGFVFGIFGTASQTAQVAVTTVTAPAGSFAVGGAGVTFWCATTAGANAYLVVTNTGTAAASVTGLTVVWAGQNNAFTPTPACSIGAAGSGTATTYIDLAAAADLGTVAVTGQSFQGTVTLSNGAEVLFTATFQ